MRPSRSLGWWGRRIAIAAVVIAQIFATLHAYDAAQKVFGWQMFNASDDWQAEIVRVTADGERTDVRDPWPGGYEWSTLVSGRGLDDPFARRHASAGLESTFDFLQNALDWAATNTPADTETTHLEARVTYWENGRGPFEKTFVSSPRLEQRADADWRADS